MEGLSLDLPLLLEAVDNILVTPANLVRQPLQIRPLQPYQIWSAYAHSHLDSAVLAARLQPEDPQGLGDNHALLAVVGRRHALKELEAFKSSRTAGSLVGDHAANGPVEDLGGCTVVEGAVDFGVDEVAFVQEVVVPQL